jgi:Fic family protein
MTGRPGWCRVYLLKVARALKVGIKTKKYEAITKCANRTASRDLSDLVAKGIIIPLLGNGRTTRYELTFVEPAGFALEKK